MDCINLISLRPHKQIFNFWRYQVVVTEEKQIVTSCLAQPLIKVFDNAQRSCRSYKPHSRPSGIVEKVLGYVIVLTCVTDNDFNFR
jgi:hypothetical protein